jgi:hypothetical protein
VAGLLDAGLWSFILDLWKLLRGNAAQRMAIALVRWGAVLAAGPPFYLVIALSLLDRVAPEQQSADATLAIAAFCLGLVMIVAGVMIFHFYHAAVVIQDNYVVAFQEGWPFEHVVRALLSERLVTFEKFTREQLDAPVRGGQLNCGTERNAVIMAGKITTMADFPRYNLIEHEGAIIVRAIP